MTRDQKECDHSERLVRSERALMDAYWRAANYLSVGQIYLYDNPLLKQSLTKGPHQAATPRVIGEPHPV